MIITKVVQDDVTEKDREMLRHFLEDLYEAINGYFTLEDEVRMLYAYFAGQQALQDNSFFICEDEEFSIRFIIVAGIPDDILKNWQYKYR